MSTDKLRVLHMTDILAYDSGVASVILNFIEGLDETKVQSDVAVTKKGDSGLYRKVEEKGGQVHELPPITLSGTGTYKKALEILLSEESYDIIHGHVANSGFLYFPIAKRAGIHHRIIHSHNSRGSDSPIKAVRNQFLNRNLSTLANHFFACSTEAGDYLFADKVPSEDVVVFPNGINTEKFAFSSTVRSNQRQLLGAEDVTIVIGHVGRMAAQKNQVFLLRAFAAYHRTIPDSLLCVLGDGPLKEDLIRQAENLNITQAVRFMGVQANPSPYYQAFDQFWMPSLFEGLPVSALEAQAAGLPCLLSDTVSRETNVSGFCSFFSTETPRAVENWAESAMDTGLNHAREDGALLLKKAGFDVFSEGKRLTEVYEIISSIEEI